MKKQVMQMPLLSRLEWAVPVALVMSFGASIAIAQQQPTSLVVRNISIIALNWFVGGDGVRGRYVNVGGPRFDDDDASLLFAVPEMDSLRLSSSKVTDASMAVVGKFVHMKTLNMSFTRITDAGLAQLHGLNDLEYLEVYDQISDAGLVALGAKPKLKMLTVGDQITLTHARIDELFPALERFHATGTFDPLGAQRLGRLAHLQYLDVAQCGLDDRFASAIGSMKNLTAIVLDGNEVGDESAAAIGGLPAIYYASFNRTKITDKGLLALASAKTLRKLQIVGTSVTADGIEQLRLQLPDVEVRFDQK